MSKRRIPDCSAVALVVLTAAAASVCGCTAPRANKPTFTGFVERETVEVRSDVAGWVVEVLVKPGDRVAARGVLVRIDSEQQRAEREQLTRRVWGAGAELAQLEAEFPRARPPKRTPRVDPQDELLRQAHSEFAVANAEATDAAIEYERVAVLFKNGDIPARRHDESRERRDFTAKRAQAARQRLGALQSAAPIHVGDAGVGKPAEDEPREKRIDAARARHAAALAALARVDARAELVEVLSPGAGTVESISVSAGDLVAPGQPIVKLVDRGSLRVRAYVPAGAIKRVRLGRAASVRLEGRADESFAGRVEAIAATAAAPPAESGLRETAFAVMIRVDGAVTDMPNGSRCSVTLGEH